MFCLINYSNLKDKITPSDRYMRWFLLLSPGSFLKSRFFGKRKEILPKLRFRLALCSKRIQTLHNIKGQSNIASCSTLAAVFLGRQLSLRYMCTHSKDIVSRLAQSNFPVQYVSTLTRTVWLLCVVVAALCRHMHVNADTLIHWIVFTDTV